MGEAKRACPVIVGPTAVGKTALITRLAEQAPLEVISLDSRQIYHGLRIGTAQPTPAELAVCPHHLIDFVSPREKYDAMRFRRDFERIHGEITARGGIPVLAGGAGMYLTALREGFLEIPGNDPQRLAEIRAGHETMSDEEVRQRLRGVDPASAARLHRNDRYRITRALEIFELSGRTMTELTAAQKPQPALGLEFPTFVLERPVRELDARIAQRTDQMLDAGWIQETEAVLAEHPYDCPGLASIGYREIVRMLRGELAREDLAASIVRVTRQYAKRQRTWFRKAKAVRRARPESEPLAAELSGLLAG